jgi:hypothetical protein
MSEKLGASEKYLPIDLSTTVPPFTLEEAFLAAYPNTGRREFTSRAIVALDGPGTITLTDSEGASVVWPMQAYEVNEIRFVGVTAASGITEIKVML